MDWASRPCAIGSSVQPTTHQPSTSSSVECRFVIFRLAELGICLGPSRFRASPVTAWLRGFGTVVVEEV